MISRQCYSSGCWTVFVCRQSMLRHMLYQRTVYTSWSADSVHLFKLLDLLVWFSTLSNLNSSNYMIYLLEFEWFEMLVSLVGNVRSHLHWFGFLSNLRYLLFQAWLLRTWTMLLRHESGASTSSSATWGVLQTDARDVPREPAMEGPALPRGWSLVKGLPAIQETQEHPPTSKWWGRG